MKTTTLIAAALASIFAVTAAAPSYAAVDPAKKERRMKIMIKRADTDKDGRVSLSEMTQAINTSFDLLDTNHDGVLSKEEIANRKQVYSNYFQKFKAAKATGQPIKFVIRIPNGVDKNFAKIDANADGKISKAEMDQVAERQFKRRDVNKDGFISMADYKA